MSVLGLRTTRLSRQICTNLLIRHAEMDSLGVLHERFEVGLVRRMKWQLDSIERVVKLIESTNQPLWVFQGSRFRVNKLGLDLWHVINTMDEVPESVLEGRRLNALLKFMVPLFRKWGPRLQYWRNPDNGLDVSHEHARRMLDHVGYVIRRVLRSRKYKIAVANDRRSAKDRYRSCAKHVLSAFGDHARILFLRVDLYFEGEGKLISNSLAGRMAIDKLVTDLNSGRIIPGLVSWIDCVEDGLERRIHHHLVAMCIGHLHQDGYHLSQAIGNYWVEQCVGSPLLASFGNCWLRRDEYRYCGLGVVHYTDTKSLMGVREALEYITKDESHSFVRANTGRKLRKSLTPRSNGNMRRGAPRQHGNDLHLAERVLLTEATPVPMGLRRSQVRSPTS